MTREWTLQHLGLSSDYRTNRWRVTPPCGHKPFEPSTTMFAVQYVDCPVCGISAWVNYNSQTIRRTGFED
jgi:hypothetical protein